MHSVTFLVTRSLQLVNLVYNLVLYGMNFGCIQAANSPTVIIGGGRGMDTAELVYLWVDCCSGNTAYWTLFSYCRCFDILR